MSRILFADDDESIRGLVTQVLSEAGHELKAVSNGQEVLDGIMKFGEPDLLILDLIMPGRSGFEVLDELHGRRAFPVLAISAIAGLRDPRYARQIGADAFLAKPFSLDELEALVTKLLGATSVTP